MKRSPISGSVLVLGGIGLVLVGLLAGILAMLYVGDVRPENRVNYSQIADQIELGRKEPVRPVVAPDSAEPPANPDVSNLNALFRSVSKEVTPSVVFIQVDVPSSGELPREWFHDFDNDRGERLFRDRVPRQSVGSGVIISHDGYIVTNNHVIEGADRIQVTLADKRQFEARTIGADHSTDLAVIKIDGARNLPVVRLGDSDKLQVGDWVLAVGNPFRLTSTVTAGIISALGRQVHIIEDRFGIEDFIQTDAAINPGNSGGALVNLNGELVGISTAIATESGSYEGYGFAVPVSLVERVVKDLIAFGEVQRGFLGVTIDEVTARRAGQLGMPAVQGVLLGDVTQGGAASRAGLRKGDVVLSIDGRSVNAPNELQRAIARYRPGDRIGVTVWRKGEMAEFNVELLGRSDPSYRDWFADLTRDTRTPEMPRLEPDTEESEVEKYELAGWGMGLRSLTSREMDAFEVESGVYLAYIKNGSTSAGSGLPRDVVILGIGEEEVATVEDAIRALDEQKGRNESVLFKVKRRDGLVAFYEVDTP